jgi:hypothetical protein
MHAHWLVLGCLACGSPHAVNDDGAGGDATAGPDVGAGDADATSEVVPAGQLELIVGARDGSTAHAPADWPVAAGPWNGKAARFSPARRQLVFETTRLDILGGQLAGTLDPAGGPYFVAGPQGGTLAPTGTSVLYVAGADGASPRCLGCTTIVDGQDGVAIYKAALSAGAPPAPIRQPGAVIYANQNKDLPFWDPSGAWIIAGVELPRHGLPHAQGNSEVGGYVDLWAISVDGKTWVQLTDFAATWPAINATSGRPLQCAEAGCAAGCQGVIATNSHPFAEYACSAAGAPPPAVGVMRPVVSHGAAGGIAGSAKLAWSERVGWAGTGYTWGGPLQAATGDLVIVAASDGRLVPAIGSYERNLTPTPAGPAGRGLWKPADGHVIGKGYETWGFTADDQQLLIASDAFLFSDKLASSPASWQALGGATQAFIDVTAWSWRAAAPAYADLTLHDPVAYPYAPNGSASPLVAQLGHWEEPVVFASAPTAFMAFASSANLSPAWNPDTSASSAASFALEAWVMRGDRSAAAHPITHLSSAQARFLTYPTDVDADTLYLSSAPQVASPSNLPGVIYRYRVAPF